MKRFNKKAQQLIEYLALFVSVIVVLIGFAGPQGPLKGGVERSMNKAFEQIYLEYYWRTGDWGPECEPCGDPILQTRKVYCERDDGYIDESKNECVGDPKPIEEQTCSVASEWCYQWRFIDNWDDDECSEPCQMPGGPKGVQTRSPICEHYTGVPVADESKCEEEDGPKPADESRFCNTQPCFEYDWTEPDWGPCEDTVGCVGTSSRIPICLCREYGSSDSWTDCGNQACIDAFNAEMFAEPKPAETESCFAGYSWQPVGWTSCPECGTNIVHEEIYGCVCSDDNSETADSTLCGAFTITPVTQPCPDLDPCQCLDPVTGLPELRFSATWCAGSTTGLDSRTTHGTTTYESYKDCPSWLDAQCHAQCPPENPYWYGGACKPPAYRWIPLGDFGECLLPTDCCKGIETRDVVCQIGPEGCTDDSLWKDTSDAECELAGLPKEDAAQQECQYAECYSWRTVGWSDCPPCGSGMNTPDLECVYCMDDLMYESEEIHPDAECEAVEPPLTKDEEVICELDPCLCDPDVPLSPATWCPDWDNGLDKVSENQPVTYLNHFDSCPDTTVVEDAAQCHALCPLNFLAGAEGCTEYNWDTTVGTWSECLPNPSADLPCCQGTRTLSDVECKKHLPGAPASDWVLASDAECEAAGLPPKSVVEVEECEHDDCYSWKIIGWDPPDCPECSTNGVTRTPMIECRDCNIPPNTVSGTNCEGPKPPDETCSIPACECRPLKETSASWCEYYLNGLDTATEHGTTTYVDDLGDCPSGFPAIFGTAAQCHAYCPEGMVAGTDGCEIVFEYEYRRPLPADLPACSVPCGPGTRYVQYECWERNTVTGDYEKVDKQKCEDAELTDPSGDEDCNEGPCLSLIHI